MNALGIAASVIFLFGCASAAAYEPLCRNGCCDDRQLGVNVFRVTFYGNAHTSRVRLEDMDFLRAAQLTLSHGYRYFVVLQSSEDHHASSVRLPGGATTAGAWLGVVNTPAAKADESTYPATASAHRPVFTNIIECFRAPPSGDVTFFSAAVVAESERAKYKIPE